jgi:formate-dependent nitrite reductase membrane component NrfD
MVAGIPLSILTAVYTAYLFAQAKARDMWQNPLLPPHLLLQTVLLGSAFLLPLFVLVRPASAVDEFLAFDLMRLEVRLLLWSLGLSSMIHLLMVWGEVSLTHPTAHARLAIWEMVKGRYKENFWTGTILSLVGGLLPLLAALGILATSLGVAGAPLALIGLMLFEHAYVQAGQSVPLA